jgi:glucose-6-phosphate 1-dehydrogenase
MLQPDEALGPQPVLVLLAFSMRPLLEERIGIGQLYETAGCLRDVIQNHLFQIVALLAMEPPATRDFSAVHTEQANVFQAMRPLTPDDLVRGQYAGYGKEREVARNSDVETFAAVRLFIDSWRREGVPWYLRSGKYLPVSETEVVVELKPPPQKLFADSAPTDGPTNYLRFRISPNPDIALAAWVKLAGTLSEFKRSCACSHTKRERRRGMSDCWGTP